MDDSSFAMYCEQIGVSSTENGSVVLNRIWDNINSNFRYKEYVPFLSENQDTMILQSQGDTAATVTIPVLGFTQEPPVLREEYDNYALVQFVSLSTWEQIEETIGNAEPDTYIRILSEKERTLTELSTIEVELTNVLGHDISFEMENRVQEKLDNDAMLNGYKLVVGALCVLLAFIGIANVFSNTLGFIRQRKREFARYMSIGMTPEGMRKNVLDRGPRHRRPPGSDHAADYCCVCVVDDNGKLPESNGIFGRSTHCSHPAFYRNPFWFCRTGILSGWQTNLEV